MSRYTKSNDTETVWLSIGWDRRLQTFFGQLEDLRQDDDNQLLFDIGDLERPYQDVAEFVRALAEALVIVGNEDFCFLPLDVQAQLEADRLASS